MPPHVEYLPVDLIQPILNQLDDRRHLTAAALVCRAFNHAATPLIYRTIDAHIKGNKIIHHPSATLLRRPELAQYVWHVTETAGALQSNPRIMLDAIAALRLCTNLVSATWVDCSVTAKDSFMPILEVLMTLPLKELSLHTVCDVGDEAWELLNSMRGIRRLSLWSFDRGRPRVLQEWAEVLGPTLIRLELGRCSGVPPTILISVFSQLPLLQELRLKDAPSAAIPSIMACLPKLIALDTEYHSQGNSRSSSKSLPRLQRLTIRTSSVDVLGPERLWSWTCSLIPHEGSLQSFSLSSFAVQGQIAIPHAFIARLIRMHGTTLKQFTVGEAQVDYDSLVYLCNSCRSLESLECTVASPDVETIARATQPAKNLRMLQLNVQWTAGVVDDAYDAKAFFPTLYGDYSSQKKTMYFSAEEAKTLMLREGSRLRTIRLGSNSYTGRWIRAAAAQMQGNAECPATDLQSDLVFEVVRDNSPPIL
ncbi:hypothetical protein ID866_9686 [Astraeus odoratus]|nr:hypothetical protein ID866_9686 [Astraeus odoratus]